MPFDVPRSPLYVHGDCSRTRTYAPRGTHPRVLPTELHNHDGVRHCFLDVPTERGMDGRSQDSNLHEGFHYRHGGAVAPDKLKV